MSNIEIAIGSYRVQAIKSIAMLTGCTLDKAKDFYDKNHTPYIVIHRRVVNKVTAVY